MGARTPPTLMHQALSLSTAALQRLRSVDDVNQTTGFGHKLNSAAVGLRATHFA